MSFSYSFFTAALLVLVAIDALPIQDTANTLDNSYELIELVRQKRQADYPPWLGAAINRKPTGGVSFSGSGNNWNNWAADAQVGLGIPVYNNGRHSVGVGATYGQGFGRYGGQPFASPPNYGFGIGYNFKF